MTDELYLVIVYAERAARSAHDMTYTEPVPMRMRIALGRAQSLLMHYVVKYASDHRNAIDDEARASVHERIHHVTTYTPRAMTEQEARTAIRRRIADAVGRSDDPRDGNP